MTQEIRFILPIELAKKLKVKAIMEDTTVQVLLTALVETLFSPKK